MGPPKTLITIDSNISTIPKLVSKHLGLDKASEWCNSNGNCERKFSTNIYYDTPISMGDTKKKPIPDESHNFVYLDYGEPNDSLGRISKNICRLKNVILISNADVVSVGYYNLHAKNCSDWLIADVISTIITTFIHDKRLLHPDDIERLVCNKPSKNIPITSGMELDIRELMEARNKSRPSIHDCDECEVDSE